MAERITLRNRASGLLLHPTSLPGPHGLGDLGPPAHAFADFLASSGQRWWQMLPIGPPDERDSPYGAQSAFAGSPLLISIERLAEEGLLNPADASSDPPPGRADYAAAWRLKEPLLRRAHAAFEARNRPGEQLRFAEFQRANEGWLPDFALFRALKRRHGSAAWTDWPPELRSREPAALARAREALAAEMRFEAFLQFQFIRQWSHLKRRCRERGIGLLGDIPIYIAHESADVWANPEIFRLDAEGRPEAVAGVPPDYFNEDGQLWGNPLYRWETLRRRGYDWWIARLRATFERFDAARLDHFIGFVNYWEVPGGAPTAREGRWREGPGADFFEKALAALGPREIIAEDLGSVTEEVFALRDRFDFPGMRVLQFAFGEGEDSVHLPHRHPARCVVYTGTHDNETTVGWFHALRPEARDHFLETIERERARAPRHLQSEGNEIHWEMIRLALGSPADTAILPVQDLLGLGSEARMNHPGIVEGNWAWRLKEGALSGEVGGRLRELTQAAGRCGEGAS